MMHSKSQNKQRPRDRSRGGRNSAAATAVSREDRQIQRAQEIATLTRRIDEEAPARGSTLPPTTIAAFASLPLSSATQRGLLEATFTTMTAIQTACIPHALVGRDILGAARTGSGKTLAFLVPIMETLFRNQFTPSDGPGAIVLSPTRELAIQIFSVLKSVGKYHTFAVGLLIGGKKDFYVEQENVGTTNVIVATPGRLLQHLEQTAHLDMTELRTLVLDEADRILDMGFREQLVRILDYLPNNQQRQTMLFSATQTRDVKSLATLSLRASPEYLGVHDAEKNETPDLLQQSYVVVPIEHKLNAIFSFVKSHLQCKTIIFMSTCAQVRHAHDLLCHLRPGVPVMALHGKLSQERRTQIFFDLIQRSAAILLATDLAARGLDFPNIDWVVQADAPEDAQMYIHRAGRTARYRSVGKSLLMVTPGEERRGFIDLVVQGGATNGNQKQAKSQKVPLKKLSINPTKATIVTDRAASLVASDVPLNTLAKKAFQSYVRSITLMPHRNIFDVSDLDLDGYAKSLGLASTPNLRFLEKAATDRAEFRDNKNVNKKLQRLKDQIKAEKLQKKIEKLGGQVTSKDSNSVPKGADDDDDESDDDLLVPKPKLEMDRKTDSGLSTVGETDDCLPLFNVHQVTNSRSVKRISVDGRTGSTSKRIVFDDDGVPLNHTFGDIEKTAVPQDKRGLEEATTSYLEIVRARLTGAKEQDTADQKDRVRQKHKKRRIAEKGEPDDALEVPVAVLGGFDNADESEGESNDHAESSAESTDEQSIASNDDMVQDVHTQEAMALALIRGK